MLVEEGKDVDADDVANHGFGAIEDVDDGHAEEVDGHCVVLDYEVLGWLA